jgi:hypothetical protein
LIAPAVAGGRWCAKAALIALCLLAHASPARAAELASATVALIVPSRTQGRLTEELRRELEASQFSVLSLPPRPATTGSDATHVEAAALLTPAGGPGRPGGPPGLIAVIAVDQSHVTIFARPTPPADPSGPLVLTSLTAEQDDRPARRRLCLAVVENLRRLPLLVPTAPVAAAVAPAAPAVAAPPAVVTTTIPEAGPRGWWFGVASDLNILSARGTPTAHVTLMAERPLGGAATLAARAAWPILGAQFTDQMRFIRTWTFAGEFGAHLRLRDRAATLRPIVGAALGLRFALADTDEFEMRASRVMLTPALTLALSAGLRYRVRPLVDLIFATDVSQGLLLLTDRRDYEAAAARERLVRLSLGILFEY